MERKIKVPRQNRIKKRANSERIVFAIAFVILTLLALSYVVALLWGVMAGFKTHTDLIINPWKLPKTWHPENYIDVFELLEVNGVKMFGMILNSLWFVFGKTILSVLGPFLMAYAVTKYSFFGRNFLIGLNLILITLPIIGSMPSVYRTYSSFGFINSPLILLPAFGGFGATNLYFCSFLRGVSKTYSEAAEIDGANDYVILFRIIMPLCKGIIFALFITTAVGVWNDYGTSLVYLPKMPTLATGIYLFSTEMTYRARMDILFAATIFSAIPPLILYCLAHKTILTNISLGGIKG